VLTLAGLVRHYVLFVIDVATRRVEIAGIVRAARRLDEAGGAQPH